MLVYVREASKVLCRYQSSCETGWFSRGRRGVQRVKDLAGY